MKCSIPYLLNNSQQNILRGKICTDIPDTCPVNSDSEVYQFYPCVTNTTVMPYFPMMGRESKQTHVRYACMQLVSQNVHVSQSITMSRETQGKICTTWNISQEVEKLQIAIQTFRVWMCMDVREGHWEYAQKKLVCGVPFICNYKLGHIGHVMN